jgi:hypothetical protein
MPCFERTSAGALAALVLAFTAPGPMAQELAVPPESQTAVAVTIYNENLALVKDRRRVELTGGAQLLSFVDVSAQIRPETALLSGGGVQVIEQNFDFDLLTPQSLLEKAVGREVRIVRTHPQSGEDRVETGTLLSVANGIVLRIGDRIELNPPGRIVLAEVPPNLRPRPTLVLQIEGGEAGSAELELAYLTGGLGWKADYVASLNAEETAIDLDGLITLTNTSGTSYRNALLQLVAGEVHQVQPMLLDRLAVPQSAAEMAAPQIREEAAFEYHLYTLERPATIAENQTKQVALMSAASIPVEKEYRFVRAVGEQDWRFAEPRRVNATVRLSFDNRQTANLGRPLPGGIIRVYKADSAGRTIFVGEDQIEHTPENETVKLALGQAFDVTATGKPTEFAKISDRVWEAAFEITVKNAKPTPITATVVEQFPADWRVLQESLPHEKTDALTASWSIPVPAKGEAKLTYRVRVTY